MNLRPVVHKLILVEVSRSLRVKALVHSSVKLFHLNGLLKQGNLVQVIMRFNSWVLPSQ